MDATCMVNGQTQTGTLNHKISTMWETEPRTTPQKTSWQLLRPEQVMMLKTVQAIWWWWRWPSSCPG